VNYIQELMDSKNINTEERFMLIDKKDGYIFDKLYYFNEDYILIIDHSKDGLFIGIESIASIEIYSQLMSGMLEVKTI